MSTAVWYLKEMKYILHCIYCTVCCSDAYSVQNLGEGGGWVRGGHIPQKYVGPFVGPIIIIISIKMSVRNLCRNQSHSVYTDELDVFVNKLSVVASCPTDL